MAISGVRRDEKRLGRQVVEKGVKPKGGSILP